MQFTNSQKRQFIEDGYCVVRQAVPAVMIHEARRLINHNLGDMGMNEADLPSLRQQSYCPTVRHDPAATGLFNSTPLFCLMESLLGRGKVRRVEEAQIALRFPQAVGTDPAPLYGHLDGLGTGLNGSNRGDYARAFTALVTIYLADVPEPSSGNFTVWPGSHRVLEAHLRQQGTDVLATGQPKLAWPHPPIQITGQAGDAVISHHQLIHSAAPNVSPNIRYAAIFRVHHIHVAEFGNGAYTDIWHEWEGLTDVREPEAATTR